MVLKDRLALYHERTISIIDNDGCLPDALHGQIPVFIVNGNNKSSDSEDEVRTFLFSAEDLGCSQKNRCHVETRQW